MPAERIMSSASEQMHTRIVIVTGARDMDEKEIFHQSQSKLQGLRICVRWVLHRTAVYHCAKTLFSRTRPI